VYFLGEPLSLAKKRTLMPKEKTLVVEATRVLKSALRVDVYVETVRNVLKVGLGSAKKVSKLALSAKNVKERLEFAKMYKDWIVCDWKRVVFNDETRINYLCYDGISWYWICDKKNLPIHAIKQTIKHGEGLVMLWSCLTVRRVGSLYKIELIVNVVY
jgi:hypothetical protein